MELMKNLNKAFPGVVNYLSKQQPPGGPPRPGLVWDPSSHRWTKPHWQPPSKIHAWTVHMHDLTRIPDEHIKRIRREAQGMVSVAANNYDKAKSRGDKKEMKEWGEAMDGWEDTVKDLKRELDRKK